MRIISDFHDYYDCGQKLDADKQTLYIRKKSSEKKHPWIFPTVVIWGNYDPVFELSVVGFCGKLYPLFKLHAPFPFFNVICCYRMEQINSFIQTYYKKEVIEQYFESSKYRRNIRIMSRTDFENFFKEWNLHIGEYEKHYAKIFEEKRCPIFVINYNFYNDKVICYNQQLKPLDFAKIFDPMSAYQEISMFMSNLAVPIKPVPEISDVTMAKVKGFNKYSFRKDPIKKKKKS